MAFSLHSSSPCFTNLQNIIKRIRLRDNHINITNQEEGEIEKNLASDSHIIRDMSITKWNELEISDCVEIGAKDFA